MVISAQAFQFFEPVCPNMVIFTMWSTGVDVFWLTVSITVVWAARGPLVPLTVKVYVAAGVDDPVETDSEDVDVVGLGVNDALAPAGRPLVTLRVTAELKPPLGVTVTE